MAALTAAILSIAGCYGQTDLATNIGQTSATLNARGTANSGPAEVQFEFWKTATPGTKMETPLEIISSGASGPFAEHVTGLDDQTAYSFRLCGTDQGTGGRPVCAQTRSFFTGLSSVQAFGDTRDPGEYIDFANVYVNVVSAPPGGTPSGRVFYTYEDHHSTTYAPGGISFDFGSKTEDNVTCVNIQGNIAVIGFRQIPPYPDSIPLRNQQFAYIIDGGSAGAGKDRFGGTVYFNGNGPDPSDCSIPSFIDSIRNLTHGQAAVSEIEANSPD